MTTKAGSIIISGAAVALVAVAGFYYPQWASGSYPKTDRGSFEAYVLYNHQDDLHGIHPCRPNGYSRALPNGIRGCAENEDAVVVRSTCWFGVPGPKIRICYQKEDSAVMGSSKPIFIQ